MKGVNKITNVENGKCCLEKVVCGVGKVIEEDALDGVAVEPWNIEESEGKGG